MQRKFSFGLLTLSLLSAACGPSAADLAATVTAASAQTQTAAPTRTPQPTTTDTPTPTPQSIPTYAPECSLVSVTANQDAKYPTFNFVVEKFLPGESIKAVLIGVKLVGNGFSFDLPFDTELQVDDQGHGEGTVAVTLIISNVGTPQIPSEFSLEITGEKSGCVITQSVVAP